MENKKKNNTAVIIVVVVVAILLFFAIIGFGGYYVYKNVIKPKTTELIEDKTNSYFTFVTEDNKFFLLKHGKSFVTL